MFSKKDRKPIHFVVEIGIVGFFMACVWLWFRQQQMDAEAALRAKAQTWRGMPIEEFLDRYPQARKMSNLTEERLTRGKLLLAPLPQPIPGHVYDLAYENWTPCYVFEKDGKVHVVVPYRT